MSDVRAPDYKLAEKDYMAGMKYKDIANKYGVSLNTVKSWKTRYKWNKKCVHTKVEKVRTQKKGAPYGNKNAVGNDGGAPKGNKNAEKYGFLSKYLPDETKEIFDAISQANPLDLLWHQIQIAYAAIVRAQRIAYVKDQQDKTKELIGTGDFDNGSTENYSVQQAWDKQENFLKAQARAQSELRSMIKQYDEMLHKDWELATDEQKARIEVLKAKSQGTDVEETEDDGFLDALEGKVDDAWEE